MSAERRWDQRHFRLEESCTQNNGQRTIFIEHMTPGTTVPTHCHEHFSETFDPLSGTISVYTSAGPHDSEETWMSNASLTKLEPGVKATVKQGEYHKYVSGPDGEMVLRVIIEPGWPDFEKLMMIMNGLAEDGELEKLGNSLELLAVVMDLANAKVIGPTKGLVDQFYEAKKEEFTALKSRLLKKYDNEESLAKLLSED